MSEDLRAKIKALEEKVRLLEIENSDWTDRAEDVFLFATTAESISSLTDEKEIFETVLEQISIMKNIPYCAFGTLGNGEMNVEYEYASFTEEEKIAKISISPLCKEKVLQKKVVIEKYDKSHSEIKVIFEKNSFTPENILIISYTNLRSQDGVFICFDNNNDGMLDSIQDALKHSVSLVNSRLDNLYLMNRLSEHNVTLETRVAESTGELEEEIREHVKTEEALRNSEGMYRTLFEKSNDAIFVVEKNSGRYINCNSAAEKLTGRTIDEITKLTTKDITYNNAEERISRISSEAESIDFGEVDYIRPDGSIRTAILSTVSFSENYIFGLAHDVTERRKAQELTREKAAFVEKNPHPVLRTKYDGTVINANLATISEFDNKIIGSSIYTYFPSLKNLFIASINTNKSVQFEEVIDKKTFLFTIKIDEKSKTYYIYGSNITKRKQAEDALKLSEEKYRVFFENNDAIILLLNPKNGNIVFANNAAIKFYGYSSEKMIGMNISYINVMTPKEIKAKMMDASQRNQNYYFFKHKLSNGEIRDVEVYQTKLVLNNQDIFSIIVHDITDRKKAEEEVLKSKEEAENADKMKSIFLAQMSHEIRTPINALVSMSSLLRYDFEESADKDQLVSFDIIDRAGMRIIRTIDLLLNLSEIQAGTYQTNFTKFDVFTEVISQIVSENKIVAKSKNIDLNLIYSVENSELYADHYTVNQIFSQLIDNAIKYTVEGEISVKILRNESKQLVVEVTDTGVGIDDKYLPKLFEPFSQEEMGYTRKYEGNGIGLALVKEYCELNNIHIEVESKKEEGSTFRIIFQ